MKDDGTGIAPVHGGPVHVGDHASYRHVWADSGPQYTSKYHELYLVGGGHAGTSTNIFARWNLDKNTPDMEVCVQPTPWATRAVEVDQEANPDDVPPDSIYLDKFNGYYSDGKPYAHHTWRHSYFLDAIDEYVAPCLASGNSPTRSGLNWHVGAGWQRGTSSWRPKKYWPDTPSGPDIATGIDQSNVFPSYTGDALYFMYGTGNFLWKLNLTTRVWDRVGTFTYSWTNRTHSAAGPSGEALMLGRNALGVPGNQAYWARFLNLTTGQESATLTTTGAAFPNASDAIDYPTVYQGSFGVRDIRYCDVLDGWLAVYVDRSPTATPLYNPGNWAYRLFRKTDATTVDVINLRPYMSGVHPVDCHARSYFYYDNTWQILIAQDNYLRNLKALKLAAI